MTKEAKKSAHSHTEKKHQDNEAVTNTVHGIRENVETFKRTADDLTHKTAEGISLCSEKMGALLKSGSAASRICMNISNEIVENCNRTASELSGISQEALACRTIHDVMALQARSLEQLSNSYFGMANKISRIAFDAWVQSLAPVLERADASSKHMRKAA